MRSSPFAWTLVLCFAPVLAHADEIERAPAFGFAQDDAPLPTTPPAEPLPTTPPPMPPPEPSAPPPAAPPPVVQPTPAPAPPPKGDNAKKDDAKKDDEDGFLGNVFIDRGGFLGYAPDTSQFGGGIKLGINFEIIKYISAAFAAGGYLLFGSKADTTTNVASSGARVGAWLHFRTEVFPFGGPTRPYFAFGIGPYWQAAGGTAVSTAGGSVENATGRYFGVAPEIGLDISARFRLALAFHVLFGADTEIRRGVTVGSPVVQSFSANFFTLALSRIK